MFEFVDRNRTNLRNRDDDDDSTRMTHYQISESSLHQQVESIIEDDTKKCQKRDVPREKVS